MLQPEPAAVGDGGGEPTPGKGSPATERGESPAAESEEAKVDLDLKSFLDDMQPRLRGTLSQFRIPVEDAEDVVQQAMLALVYQWGDIRDPEAWLIGTVRNKCLLYWRERRRKVYSSVDSLLLDWLSDTKGPAQTRVELACDLTVLIAKLPERCREILRLRYALGFSPTEVADRLGYQPSSISKVTSRCMAGLLDQMIRCGYCSYREAHPAESSRELSGS